MRRSVISLSVAAFMASAAGLAQAEMVTYNIDPTHTFVMFEISHYGASMNRVRFDKREGTIQFDRANKKGKVDISVDVASVNSGTPFFDKRLMKDDLFNTEKYPTIRFTADQFTFKGENVSEVTGELTLLGKKAPLTLKANQFTCYPNPLFKREVCGGDFEATIDRTVWGMDFAVEHGMTKTVRLVVQVEGIKQDPKETK